MCILALSGKKQFAVGLAKLEFYVISRSEEIFIMVYLYACMYTCKRYKNICMCCLENTRFYIHVR